MTERDDNNMEPRSAITAPDIPPHAMVKRETRRAALISYLGPVVVLFVVVGIALIYWANRTPEAQVAVDPIVDGGVGTTGSTEGGGGVQPSFGGTREEVNYRGANMSKPEAATAASADVLATVGAASAAPAGQQVSLRNVQVAEVRSDVLWVNDGQNRIAVTIPENASTVTANSRVDVDGVTESNGGAMRVRASRIHAR